MLSMFLSCSDLLSVILSCTAHIPLESVHARGTGLLVVLSHTTTVLCKLNFLNLCLEIPSHLELASQMLPDCMGANSPSRHLEL